VNGSEGWGKKQSLRRYLLEARANTDALWTLVLELPIVESSATLVPRLLDRHEYSRRFNFPRAFGERVTESGREFDVPDTIS